MPNKKETLTLSSPLDYTPTPMSVAGIDLGIKVTGVAMLKDGRLSSQPEAFDSPWSAIDCILACHKRAPISAAFIEAHAKRHADLLPGLRSALTQAGIHVRL